MAAVQNDSAETWEAELKDSDLICPICMEFLCEPLLLECNHAFCRLCLLQSSRLAPDGRHCPNCRRPIELKDPVTHPANRLLVAQVAEKVPAKVISDRSLENAKKLEKFLEMEKNSIPVFYMRGVASRVGEDVFLHFFEPRYRILIRRAWEGNKRFICTQRQPSDGDRGLLVEVNSAKFRADGKADIHGRGIEIVELKHVRVEDGTGGLYYADVGESPPQSSSARSSSRDANRSSRGSRVSARELEVQLILRRAIQEGAPRYNRGDHAGCSAVYFATAERCLMLLEAPGGATGERMVILLRQAVQDSRNCGSDVNASAWALRHAFDDVLAMSLVVDTSEQELARDETTQPRVIAGAECELPIFYLAPGVEAGSNFRLTFFESRYRRLAREVWTAPEPLFLYSGSVPSEGSSATVVRLERCDWDAEGCALVRGKGVEFVRLGAVRQAEDGLYYAQIIVPTSVAQSASRSNRTDSDSVTAKCSCVVL